MLKYHYILPYAIAVILAFLLFRSCERANTLQDLQSSLNDTLLQSRNKIGQQVSSISVLSAGNKKQLLSIQSQDTTIKKLQQLVKKYKGSLQGATVASTETTDTGTTEAVISKMETTEINGVIDTLPVYTTSWKERWSEGTIEAHHDSIHRNIKIKNEFTFTHGTKRNLFKKDVLKVEMTNLNPNTVTTELRSYSVSMPKKRFSIGVGVSAGYSLTTYKPDAVVGLNASFILFGF